jgi:hypothetical protein
MPILAIIFCIGKDVGYEIGGIEIYTLTLYAYISLACGLAMFFAGGFGKKLRIGLGVVYIALMIPLCVFYAVQMVQWEEPAAGIIRQETDINIFVGTITKKP